MNLLVFINLIKIFCDVLKNTKSVSLRSGSPFSSKPPNVKKYGIGDGKRKKTSKNKGTLVILMHDSGDVNDTASILKDSISFLRSQGYEFHNFYDFITDLK